MQSNYPPSGYSSNYPSGYPPGYYPYVSDNNQYTITTLQPTMQYTTTSTTIPYTTIAPPITSYTTINPPVTSYANITPSSYAIPNQQYTTYTTTNPYTVTTQQYISAPYGSYLPSNSPAFTGY